MKEPLTIIDASFNVSALMDGPKGKATRFVVFASKEAFARGDVPLVAFDFENRQQVFDWLSINLQMVSKVVQLMKAREGNGH
jgi:hypothetical protein